jgi:hypothetical protein
MAYAICVQGWGAPVGTATYRPHPNRSTLETADNANDSPGGAP